MNFSWWKEKCFIEDINNEIEPNEDYEYKKEQAIETEKGGRQQEKRPKNGEQQQHEGKTNNKNAEQHEKKKHETKTNRDRGGWARILSLSFHRNLRNHKVSIGVGDDVVNEEEEIIKEPFWKCLCRMKKKIEMKARETNKQPRRLDKFVTSLQREAVIVEKEIIASSIASVLSTFISHPFEVIKSNFLSLRFPKKHFENFATHIQRRRVVYVIKDLILTKGLGRLYKGHIAAQRDSLSQTISMFWTYQLVSEFLETPERLKEYPNFSSFISGFVSATIPVLALAPLDTLRERRNMRNFSLKKYGKVGAPSIIKSKDMKYLRPLFRNCFSLYLHMGTLYGLRFLFFNRICEEMMLLHATHDKATSTNPNVSEVDTITRLTNYQLMIAGGAAAFLGDLVAHPLDVLHTRMKMKTLERQQFRFENTCRRLGQCFRTIIRNESIFAFYSGLVPSMIKSVISIAAQFTLYEKTKRWLNPFFPT